MANGNWTYIHCRNIFNAVMVTNMNASVVQHLIYDIYAAICGSVTDPSGAFSVEEK